MAGREAKRNEERLYFKFLVKYFENLHPDLYDEAVKLYIETKKMNKGVKDQTKTAHFMSVVTPHIRVPRYYYTREVKANTPQQLQGSPQMVLEIPLHKPQSLQPTPVPAPVSSQPTTTTIPSPPVSSQPATTSMLPLDDTVYQQVIEEIQRDPDMLQILNNFNFDDDDDDTNAYVFNDVYRPDDLSPLVNELLNIF